MCDFSHSIFFVMFKEMPTAHSARLFCVLYMFVTCPLVEKVKKKGIKVYVILSVRKSFQLDYFEHFNVSV